MERKKIFMLVGILAITLVVSMGAYLYLNRSQGDPSSRGVPFPGSGNPIQNGTQNPPAGNIDDEMPPLQNDASIRLYELHKTPISGIGFAEQPVGNKKVIFARIIERGLGHIFETNLETLIEKRISAETYPGIAEAFFVGNGRTVVIRSLTETEGTAIKTRSLVLPEPIISFAVGEEKNEDIPITPKETILPDYIPHLVAAEDGSNRIFYLENDLSSARGTVATATGGGPSVILSGAFTEWLPQLPNRKLATITTKASSRIPGHLFFVNTETSALTKILGNIRGLTTSTSRDGRFVLYTETVRGVPTLFTYNVAKKESRATPLKTIAEKCTWRGIGTSIAYCAVPKEIPGGIYPDQWYQGIISFSDDMWKINAETGATERLFAPEQYNGPAMDIVNPLISSDGTYMVFINKKTATPWMFSFIEKAKVVTP